MVEDWFAGNHESPPRLLQARHVEVDLLVHRVPPRAVVWRVAAVVGLRRARQDHVAQVVAWQDHAWWHGRTSDRAAGHHARRHLEANVLPDELSKPS